MLSFVDATLLAFARIFTYPFFKSAITPSPVVFESGVMIIAKASVSTFSSAGYTIALDVVIKTSLSSERFFFSNLTLSVR